MQSAIAHPLGYLLQVNKSQRAWRDMAMLLTKFLTLCWLQVYAALNAVGEVGWSINQPMLDVIQDAYDRSADDEQMAICDLPRHHNVAMLAANKSRRFRTARTGTQLLAEVRVWKI
jgi:DNA-directed RNA polymerase